MSTSETSQAIDQRITVIHDETPTAFDITGSLKGLTGTFDELHDLYKKHSTAVGFSFKKSTSRRDADGEIAEKYFLCSCFGIPKSPAPVTPSPIVIQQTDGVEPKKKKRTRQNTTTKKDCKAKMTIKLVCAKTKFYVVHQHITEHTHKLTRAQWGHFHRSNRKISEEKGQILETMEESLIRPTDAFNYMVQSAGGQENVGNILRDHINWVTRYRTKKMGGADAQHVLNLLQKRKNEDPNFYFMPKLDEKGKLCNLYWRDSMMKDDYELYGDVMVFDTTFRTNKYGLICAPFVGVNNHWNNVMFACAFIANESAESFEWLFEEFLKSMGGKKPITIFTDQDKAITKSIKQVFGDETRHKLCLWHIYQNAIKHCPRLKIDKDFKEAFDICLYSFDNEEQFEHYWVGMVFFYDLEDEKWFKTLYKHREKWSPALSKSFFSAGILSSQRSESTNNAISFKSNKNTSLTQFFRLFDAMIDRWRTNETHKEFKNSYSAPKIYMRCGLVKHAAEVYTLKIFKYFQKEFRRSLETTAYEGVVIGDKVLYDVVDELPDDANEDDVAEVASVVFIKHPSGRVEISCSCKHFEEVGWLCKHCIRVLDRNSVKRIPEEYIMKRWTKTLKDKVWDHVLGTKSTDANAQERIAWRQSMNRDYTELVIKSEGNIEARKILENGYRRDLIAIKEIIDASKLSGEPEKEPEEQQSESTVTTMELTSVQDPDFTKTKGRTPERKKSCLERKNKKQKTDFVQPPDTYVDKYLF